MGQATHIPGYSYRLREGVSIQPQAGGAVVVSRNPLLAARISAPAIRVLHFCREWRTPQEIGATLGIGRREALDQLLGYLHSRQFLERRPVAPEHPEDWPIVSVVVPVRNRPQDIVRCVESLRALDYPPDRLEIVVVDDGSTDATPEIVGRLAGVRAILMSAWSGPAACRNAGAAAAGGAIVAYTDSDCEVSPGWLRDLAPYFADPDLGVVGGRVDSFGLDTPIERYESVVSSLYMGEQERECKPNSAAPFLPTANLLIRRALWQQLGGFDPAFPIGEDVDLVWRAHAAGKRVLYVPRGAVRHKYRCRLGQFARRKAFYGGSETFLLRKHPEQQKLFHIPRARLPFVIALLLAFVLWPPLAIAAGIVPPAEMLARRRALRRFGARVPLRWVADATARSYDALLFHLCGNIARYYALPLLAAGLLYTPLLWLALACFLYPALHTYHERRPPLGFPTFAALYLVELAAHQAGMLRRCAECRTLAPFVPALRVS
jgi:mycofactocin system glycosyltransferase